MLVSGASVVRIDVSDLDRGRRHRDRAAADLEHQLHPGLDQDLLTHRDGLVLGDIHLVVAADGDLAVAVVDVEHVVALLDLGLARSIARSAALLAFDRALLGVLDRGKEILLGMETDEFDVFLVLEPELVVGLRTAALARASLEAALGFVGRQVLRRHVVLVVDGADHQRAVGVAFDEFDHCLHADARNVEAAPFLAGPGVRHAHPARGLVVLLALPVPVELELHPAILVGVDLLAGRPDHQRCLRAVHHRPRRDLRGAERAVLRLQQVVAAVGFARFSAARAVLLPNHGVTGRNHEIVPVL